MKISFRVKKTMSYETFADAMREIAEMDVIVNEKTGTKTTVDEEIRHVMADGLMMDLLISLGYEEGVEVFDAMDKWYA